MCIAHSMELTWIFNLDQIRGRYPMHLISGGQRVKQCVDANFCLLEKSQSSRVVRTTWLCCSNIKLPKQQQECLNHYKRAAFQFNCDQQSHSLIHCRRHRWFIHRLFNQFVTGDEGVENGDYSCLLNPHCHPEIDWWLCVRVCVRQLLGNTWWLNNAAPRSLL